MATVSQALKYVKGNEGIATPETFFASFQNGEELWNQLLSKGYVTIRDGKMYLTTIGEKML